LVGRVVQRKETIQTPGGYRLMLVVMMSRSMALEKTPVHKKKDVAAK
jgi:hypothetical protein